MLLGKTTTPEFALEGRHRLAPPRRHRQPVGRRADRRRVQRRSRHRGRAGHGGLVGGHRRWRVGADPGGVHRHGRAQADVRAGADLPAEPVRHPVARRPDDPHRRRRGRDARHPHRLRPARLVGDADSRPVVPGRARRRASTGPAHRVLARLWATCATTRRSTAPCGPRSRCWPPPAPSSSEVDPGFTDPVEAFHVLWFAGAAKVVAAYGAGAIDADRSWAARRRRAAARMPRRRTSWTPPRSGWTSACGWGSSTRRTTCC